MAAAACTTPHSCSRLIAGCCVQEYGDPLIGDGEGSGVLMHGDAPPAVPGPTPCLCIDNMVRDAVFAEEDEYQVSCVLAVCMCDLLCGNART
jgi:hypothetical protein